MILSTVFLVVSSLILYPAMLADFHTAWVRGEFYFTVAVLVMLFLLLAWYLHNNSKQAHWTQRYLLSIGVMLTLPFYYFTSLASGHDIPLLFGLLLVSILYVIPVLVLLHGIAFLIRRGSNKKGFSQME